MWLATFAVPWPVLFVLYIILYALFISQLVREFLASIDTSLEKNHRRPASVQIKLGAIILHIALGIMLIFGGSSATVDIGYTLALVTIGIGSIVLIMAVFIQVRNNVIHSIGGYLEGLATSLLSLIVCWWAITESFYVYYLVFGFWAFRAIPKVNNFALSTRNSLIFTISVLCICVVFGVAAWQTVGRNHPVFT